MKKAWLIARWEFRAAVFRRGYIVAVVLMPLLFFGLGAISALTTSTPAARAASRRPTAVVDKAGILDLAFATERAAERERLRTPDLLTDAPGASLIGVPALTAYDDEQQALRDMADQKIVAVYVIEADYLTTGKITTYGRDTSLFGQAEAGQRVNAVGDAIRASLMRRDLETQALMRAYAPTLTISRKVMAKNGEITDATDSNPLGNFLGTLGVFMMFTMAIFFSAGFLQQATVEDRQNRVFEMLLSSVDPESLIIGKIAGLGAAGLLQVALYVVILIGAGSTALPSLNISPRVLTLAMAYFIVGYLLFASLMAAVGMIARSAQESAQLSAIWTLTAMSPMFFFAAIINAPNGAIARTLSFFPLSSPTTMLLRLTMSPDVPVMDIVISLALGIVSVYFALTGIIKIFRAATLMYGKRPTLPELLHWLRAA
ncbi:MAG TPA: ABC transporter permease [Vicinamibacterales bacterium]|jgi:ABC-2 type transport system permease protein|nr:ABC transporter permease [Vicinamibacterales bacterium]